MPDRMDRLSKLKAELKGLTLDSTMEPSHCLVDRAVSMAEQQVILYVEPSRCTSRFSEIGQQKREGLGWIEASTGVLKLTKKTSEGKADTSTELQLKACLQRRALAIHTAGLASFQKQDEFISGLFALLLKPPIDGYKPASVSQIVNADRALRQLIAQHTRGQVLTVGSPSPVEVALERFKDHPDVTYYLLPLPSSGGQRKRKAADSSSEDRPGERQAGKKKTKKVKKTKQEAVESDQPDKAKDPPKKIDLPAGCVTKDEKNRPLCFGYNRGTCKE